MEIQLYSSSEPGYVLINKINVVMLRFCFVLFEAGSQYVALAVQ